MQGRTYQIVITPRDYQDLTADVITDVKMVKKDHGWAGWVATNEEYGIVMSKWSNNPFIKKWKRVMFKRLKEEVIEDIDFMVDRYIVQGYSKVNDSLRKHIENLKKIVDVSKHKDPGHWVMAWD